MIRSALIAAGLALLASPAFADGAPVDCQATDKWFVVMQDNPGTVGKQFSVLAKATTDAEPECNWEAAKGGTEIGDIEDPMHFEGLGGDYLVMLRATGPVLQLVIRDLAQGTVIFDDVVAEYETDETGVTYWLFTGDATAETCPEFAENEAQGMRSLISAENRFDFATGQSTATGKTRCDARP